MENLDIQKKLDTLVGERFTEEELNARLSQLFGCEVKVEKYEREECVKREMPELDDQFLFNIENELVNLDIDVDLYYLVDNGGKFYITETNFERV